MLKVHVCSIVVFICGSSHLPFTLFTISTTVSYDLYVHYDPCAYKCDTCIIASVVHVL